MRIVDNSAIGKAAAEIGKPPRVINVYNKQNVSCQEEKGSNTVDKSLSPQKCVELHFFIIIITLIHNVGDNVFPNPIIFSFWY